MIKSLNLQIYQFAKTLVWVCVFKLFIEFSTLFFPEEIFKHPHSRENGNHCIVTLLGVVTQLCSQQSEGTGGVCDSLWPYVEAVLKLADAVHQVNGIFYSAWGAW